MDAGVLVSVALILVGQKPRLQNHHPHGKDIASEGVVIVLHLLLLEGLHLLRRKVYMRCISVAEQRIIIGRRACGYWIVDLDDAVGGDED